MPQAPWKIRISADGAGTLAAVHATVELVNRASFGCPKPWAHYRGDAIDATEMERFTFWPDITGNGRHITSTFDAESPERLPAKVTSLSGQAGADFSSVNVLDAPSDLECNLAAPFTFENGVTKVQVMHDVGTYGNWESNSTLLRVRQVDFQQPPPPGALYFYLDERTVDEVLRVRPEFELRDNTAFQAGVTNSLTIDRGLGTRTMVVKSQYLPEGLGTEVNGDYALEPANGTTPIPPLTIDRVLVGGSGRCVVLDTIVIEGDGSGLWDFGDGLCETLDAYLLRRYGTIDPGPEVGTPDPDPSPETPVLYVWAITETSLAFNWKPVWQADLNEIEVTVPGGASTVIQHDPTTEGTIVYDEGLTSGTTRTYRVRARSGGVWTDWSAPLTMTTL